MKRTIFIFLCAAVALCATAETTRLNRADLKRAEIIKDRIVNTSPATSGHKASLSIQQFLKERNLTLADNRLNSKSPRLREDNQQTDDIYLIASMNAWDFEWNDSTGTATVNDTSCVMAGKYCKLHGDTIEGLYGEFSIPILINYDTREVTIPAGDVLSTISMIYNNNPIRIATAPTIIDPTIIDKTWSLYAMPLSWLIGNDSIDDIHGEIYEDGTIYLEDSFAFLVSETVCYDNGFKTSWKLSEIFSDFCFYVPNAIHEFETTITHNNNNSGSGNHYIKPGPEGPVGSGHGGLVPPTRPVNSGNGKPINPRPINPPNNLGYQNNDNATIAKHEPSLSLSSNYYAATSRFDWNWPRPPRPDNTFSSAKPVYMYQADDVTLLVYNLFGTDFCWNYIYLLPDSSMYFPKQIVSVNSESFLGLQHDVYYYNCSGDISTDTLTWGNIGTWSQDTITWGKTHLATESNTLLDYSYDLNALYFTDDISFATLPSPVFEEPLVTDSTVVFNATCTADDGIVFLAVVDEDNEEITYPVNNPYEVRRANQPYPVLLIAEIYFESINKYSDVALFDYLVPPIITLGDVNGDSEIAINDVTCLINALLTGEQDEIYADACDMNQDGEISIADITILINYLLTGVKPY